MHTFNFKVQRFNNKVHEFSGKVKKFNRNVHECMSFIESARFIVISAEVCIGKCKVSLH